MLPVGQFHTFFFPTSGAFWTTHKPSQCLAEFVGCHGEGSVPHPGPGAGCIAGPAQQDGVGTSFLILVGTDLSSSFWSRSPDTSNAVPELSGGCVAHLHSCIRHWQSRGRAQTRCWVQVKNTDLHPNYWLELPPAAPVFALYQVFLSVVLKTHFLP